MKYERVKRPMPDVRLAPTPLTPFRGNPTLIVNRNDAGLNMRGSPYLIDQVAEGIGVKIDGDAI